MCACEPGYVCSKCEATPQDWRREFDEPPPEVVLAPVREVDGSWQPWL